MLPEDAESVLKNMIGLPGGTWVCPWMGWTRVLISDEAFRNHIFICDRSWDIESWETPKLTLKYPHIGGTVEHSMKTHYISNIIKCYYMSTNLSPFMSSVGKM